MFAYLHGSILSSASPRDVDIAVYLFPEKFEELTQRGELNLSFVIPLEMALEKETLHHVDIQVLNQAPLGFRYRIVTGGVVVVDKDSNLRCDFEHLSRVEYFDFRPKHKEYVQEVMS
jgi:predicted nucleotidyltransferase